MKKLSVLSFGLCAVLALASCGTSKESAYRKAYERAQAQEAQQAQAQENTPVVSEPVVTPLETTTPTMATSTEVDNATVRQESVTLVSGSGLQNFSVVVGSFSLRANAEGLANNLKNAGYDSQVVFNSDRNMYRVIASTFADKAGAVQSRNQLRAGKYPDAWLLFKK